MAVKFEQLEKGDTVKYNGRMAHLMKNTRLNHYDSGEVLQVKKILPAGIIAENDEGHEAEFYFEHGAEKLDYTPDTVKAIQKRSDFRKKKAEEDAADAPDPRDAQLTAMKSQVEEMRGLLQDLQKQLAGKAEDKP